MKTFNENADLHKTIGANMKSLKQQAGLTTEGFCFAVNISGSYVHMLERGAVQGSIDLLLRIANFYEIKFARLVSKEPIELGNPLEIPTIARFYKENEHNPKFFVRRRGDYSIAIFMREVLTNEPFMESGHTVGEIIEYCKQAHDRTFKSEEASRVLRRLFLDGVLERTDKFKNGTVFLYSKKKKDSGGN